MASKYQLVALAIFAVALPVALATDYVVGDDDGWKPGVNYTVWASGKVFYVGDRLVFTYPQGKHDVVKVNAENFRTCNATGSETLNTGNDTIPLLISGKKWYICGFDGHCANGQKLVINVEDQAPAPEPEPANSARNGLIASSWNSLAPAPTNSAPNGLIASSWHSPAPAPVNSAPNGLIASSWHIAGVVTILVAAFVTV